MGDWCPGLFHKISRPGEACEVRLRYNIKATSTRRASREFQAGSSIAPFWKKLVNSDRRPGGTICANFSNITPDRFCGFLKSRDAKTIDSKKRPECLRFRFVLCVGCISLAASGSSSSASESRMRMCLTTQSPGPSLVA